MTQNSSKINNHANRLDQQDRQIRQESLDRKMNSMIGKFAVYGYKWKLRDFGSPSNAIRRQFIRKFFRSVLVNQHLLPPTADDEEDFKADLITDLKPLGFRDDASFEMTIGNLTIYHAIKEKLPSARLKIRLRPMQPKIIGAMVDDALRHRRTLLDASPSRTLYVETKITPPYVVLMEKKKYSVGGVEELRREIVTVPWSDPRFADPLMHHETFGKPTSVPGATPPTSSGVIGAVGGATSGATSGTTRNTRNNAGDKAKKPKRGGGGSRGGGGRGGGNPQGNRSHSSHGNDTDDDMI